MPDTPQSQNRPSSPSEAPDPSFNYERSHPEREAGMGRLDNNPATPMDQPDDIDQAVKNKHEPRQLNAHETADNRADQPAPETPPPSKDSVSAQRVHGTREPDHSMSEDDPLDEFPTEHQPAPMKRHSRTGGKGGTPDAGEARRNG